MSVAASHEDRIASCVISAFEALPRKAKPNSVNGVREWTSLAGIVIAGADSDSWQPEQPSQTDNTHLQLDKYRCVALGSGMQCLPSSKLSLAHGTTLHDWHAEVVAIRAFNLFLLQECSHLAVDACISSSAVVERNDANNRDAHLRWPFRIRKGLRIYMYCSEAPCGDASMELIMDAQEDATPWKDHLADNVLLNGRGYFSRLGAVRRKPSRNDAPFCASKSCSDKIALKQCTSLLSSFTCLFVEPSSAYLTQLILPRSWFVLKSVDRAFSGVGRMSAAAAEMFKVDDAPFTFKGFECVHTSLVFQFGKDEEKRSQGSKTSVVWTPSTMEVLTGGTRMGFKQFDRKGRSAVSRVHFWSLSLELASALGLEEIVKALGKPTYGEVKNSEMFTTRKAAKETACRESLRGWIRNSGDDLFSLKISS